MNMNKKILYSIVLLSTVFIPAIIFSGCPASDFEVFLSTQPTADVTTVSRTNQKTAVFTLTSVHPVNSVWKVYDVEFGGEPLFDVEASYLRSQNRLTLIYKHNILPLGDYWVSVTERASDESLRLGLTVQ